MEQELISIFPFTTFAILMLAASNMYFLFRLNRLEGRVRKFLFKHKFITITKAEYDELNRGQKA